MTETCTRGEVDELSNGGRLPRIQFHAKAKSYGELAIPAGHYAIVKSKDEAQALGGNVAVLPLACRVKALDLRNRQRPVEYFDKDNELYKDAKRLANTKDGNCMWGPEFLVYEPTTGTLCTMFWGSKSSRTQYDQVRPFLPLTDAEAEKAKTDPHPAKPCTLTFKMSTGEFSYAIPEVKPAKAAIDAGDVEQAVTEFLGVKDDVVAAPEEEDERA